jgi:hypothetical protein
MLEKERENFTFFRSLSFSVIELLTSEVLAHQSENITWGEFFDIFCRLRDSTVHQNLETIRKQWHPASRDYCMEKESTLSKQQPSQDKITNEEPDSGPPENFTIDEASSDNSIKDFPLSIDVKKSGIVVALPKPHAVHPVFFGYRLTKSSDLINHYQEQRNESFRREVRAIANARRHCEERLKVLEKQVQNQRAHRKKKIDQLQDMYEQTTQNRIRDFSSSTQGATEETMANLQVGCCEYMNVADFLISSYTRLNLIKRLPRSRTHLTLR